MRAGKSDTPKEVESLIIQGYRRMSPREKLQRVRQLNRSVRTLVLAGIRQRYGSEISEREERLRLAAFSINRETMIQAFGWIQTSMTSDSAADIIADLRVESAHPFVERLGEDFYADAEGIDRAHLQAMADDLGLTDLLEELLREAVP